MKERENKESWEVGRRMGEETSDWGKEEENLQNNDVDSFKTQRP